jgi:hypothetical protein
MPVPIMVATTTDVAVNVEMPCFGPGAVVFKIAVGVSRESLASFFTNGSAGKNEKPFLKTRNGFFARLRCVYL